MANDLLMLDMVDLANQGADAGRKQRFSRLAGQAAAAPDATQRNALLTQMIGANPTAGMEMQKQFRDNDDNDLKRAVGAARYMKEAIESGDAARIEGSYQNVRPYLAKLGAAQGKVPPPNWSDEMKPGVYQLIASGEGVGSASGVLSTYIDGDGNRVAVMRDATRKVLGKAEEKLAFRDQPGTEPSVVNLRDRTASPVTMAPAGVPATAAPVSIPGVTMQSDPQLGQVATAGTGDNAVRVGVDDLSPEQNQRLARTVSLMQEAGYSPQEVDAWVNQQMQQGRDVPSFGAPAGPTAAPAAGGALPARPTSTPADQERLRLAQEANARAAEANQRAAEAAQRDAERDRNGAVPAGYRRTPNGIEPIPGGPADKPGSDKPVPIGALKELLSVEEALSSSGTLASLVKKHADRMVAGKLTVQPADAIGAQLRTATGSSNANDVNLNEYRADMTRIVNESLRLNKGVQTEGDSQRAVQELMDANDQATAARALRRVATLNNQAIKLQAEKRRLIRANYGQDAAGNPLSRSTPAARAQVAQPKTAEDFARLPSGATYIDPEDGKTYRKP